MKKFTKFGIPFVNKVSQFKHPFGRFSKSKNTIQEEPNEIETKFYELETPVLHSTVASRTSTPAVFPFTENGNGFNQDTLSDHLSLHPYQGVLKLGQSSITLRDQIQPWEAQLGELNRRNSNSSFEKLAHKMASISPITADEENRGNFEYGRHSLKPVSTTKFNDGAPIHNNFTQVANNNKIESIPKINHSSASFGSGNLLNIGFQSSGASSQNNSSDSPNYPQETRDFYPLSSFDVPKKNIHAGSYNGFAKSQYNPVSEIGDFPKMHSGSEFNAPFLPSQFNEHVYGNNQRELKLREQQRREQHIREQQIREQQLREKLKWEQIQKELLIEEILRKQREEKV